jgi:ABC-type lipoprotein export system ATPase subunit
MSLESVLNASGMHLRRGTLNVLAGVDLDLAPGSLTVLSGPSGCGKTTLLHALCGLLPLDRGQVTVRGTPLSEDNATELRRTTLGLLTQDLHLLGALDPVRNAALPLLLNGVSPAEACTAARSLLQELGLDPDTAPTTERLSRGQRQRVALARALVFPRPVLLLDEPTSSVDPDTRDAILDRLRGLAEGGTAILLTTHDTGLVPRADRHLCFVDGTLEAR